MTGTTYSGAIGEFVIGYSPIGGPWPGSIIPSLTADDFETRLAVVFPNGWASQAARQTGLLSFLFGAIGQGLAFQITALQYALYATRIQQAVNGALDLASEDFFGNGLPRIPNETDDAFRTRILAALSLLGEGATRSAISAVIKALTGVAPMITEPWNPQDTGVWDGQPGQGMMFWDVDVPNARARWTSYQGQTDHLGPWLNGNPLACLDVGNGAAGWYVDEPSSGSAYFDFAGALVTAPDQIDLYQGFIDSVPFSVPILSGNPVNCLDLGSSPNGWYVDAVPSGSAYFNFAGAIPAGTQEIYNLINQTKVFGTVAWVKFLPNLTTPLHQ